MQLALTVAGAAIGFQIGGPQGAAIGASIGSAAGAYFFGPELPDIEGPRLSDLKVQTSTFGVPIPIVYGAYRLTGNVIYSTDIIETRKDEEVGGKGPSGATQTTYSYSVTCAVGVCEGPVDGIRRIWANGKLIYNADTGLTDSDVGDLRIYLGAEDQNPDPFWQGVYGSDNVPAHRGLAYVTFENLQLATFGNRIPNFSFEVYPAGTAYWMSTLGNSEFNSDFTGVSLDIYQGYIYHIGTFRTVVSSYVALTKQDLEGNIVLIKRFDDTFGVPSQIKVRNNYVYVLARNELLKCDLDLNIIWQKYIDLEIDGLVQYFSYCFDVDNDGNSFVCITVRYFVCLMKIDTDGDLIWESYKAVPDYDPIYAAAITDVNVSQDGYIYLTSSRRNHTYKFDPSGNIEWVISPYENRV
jgi:hypothetical protein